MKKMLEKFENALSKNELKQIKGGGGTCTCPSTGVVHAVGGRNCDDLQATGDIICGENANCIMQ